MKVLFVESPGVRFEGFVRALSQEGVEADAARDAQMALWLLAGGAYRVVVVPLTGGELEWEVVAATLWSRPPGRVIALAESPVDPALRRKAYGAGVWELGELPRQVAPGDPDEQRSLVPTVRRALRDIRPAALLVETSGEEADGIESMLAGAGFRVDAASNVEEALGLMSRGPYALVVVEAADSGRDGLRAAREALGLQSGVPVVVLATTMEDDLFLRAVEMGASACLWKMAEPADLERELIAAAAAARVRRTGRT